MFVGKNKAGRQADKAGRLTGQAGWQGRRAGWIDVPALTANIIAMVTDRTNIHNDTGGAHH
jgi:hypothetical protein